MKTKKSLLTPFMALVLVTNAQASVVITPATGGGAISADKAANGITPTWTTLGPITIAEGKKQDFGNKVKNGTLILKAPTGFEFNTASTPSIGYARGADVTAASVAVSDSSTLTITYSTASQKSLDTLIIGATGLQVRPTRAGPVATGRHIYATGGGSASIDGIATSSDGTDGSNFGTLTEVAAAYAQLQLLLPGETAAPGTALGKLGTPSAQTAGAAFNVVVNAADRYWNVATPIANVVALTTTDPQGTVPAPASLAGGTRTLAITLKTAGSWTVTATDQSDGTKGPVTSPPVGVNPGPASVLAMAVQPSASVVAGDVLAQQPVVLIEDAYGNVRSNDTLTVTATASSGPGTLLGGTSVAAVGGAASFNNLAPTAALNVTLRFTSGGLTPAVSSNIQVSTGPFGRLLVLLPGQSNAQGTATGRGGTASATAGTNTAVLVIATDNYFNPVGGVTDLVAVTTTDLAAVLPANAALAGGSNTFNLQFKIASNQTVTASDVSDGTKIANTDPVVVSAGPFVKLQLLVPGETPAPATISGKTGTPTTTMSGTSFPVIVNGVDANWNVAPTANGAAFTIQITSSDTNAISPANADLALGSRTFNIALRTVGNWTVTATDVDDVTKTPSTSSPITVTPTPFTRLQVLLPGEFAAPGSTTGKGGTPLAQTAGTPFNVSVNSVDANWNPLVTNDVVHVTSSDTNAVLPGDTLLNNGTANVALTLKTAGTSTIRAADVTHPAILPDTSSALTVNPGAFVKLQLLAPGERAVPGTASGKAGTALAQTSSVPFTVTVNGVDANFNVVNTNDTIHITASDPAAVLPANAALAAGSRNFSVALPTAGTGMTVTGSDVTHATIAPSTSSPLTIVPGAGAVVRTGPIVAVHDSELTRALETMNAAATTPSGSGTTGKEWWPTNWHYFVMPESLKEALRSDGTAFDVISDADITAGKLLDANGRPRYPIMISLASEAVADTEIGPLASYVAAGGFMFVGSSAFTRNPNGTTRGDFALASQMAIHSFYPGMTNWRANSAILKQAEHRVVSHIPSGQPLYWEMPSGAEEIPWGTYPHPGNPQTQSAIWMVQSSSASVLMSADVTPFLLDSPYGSGHFIYDAAMQPLIGHGGWAPGMYSYLIIRKAIEWAFDSARMPIPKISPWPYPYNAALMVRHDLEDYQNEIAGIESSAQFEFANGVKGEYYFCTGTLREEMSPGYDTNAVVASLRRAVSNNNALVSSHNGGLRNPYNNPPLTISSYDFWHWGLDEALNATITNYPNGKIYALTSLSNSFRDIEGWLPGLANPNRRAWVAPYFDATREDSFDIENQLGVKAIGEQKLTVFPSWVVSTATAGKRYPFISLPVSDWYVGNTVAQSLEAGHNTNSIHALVDFYYGLGGLINLYSHTLSTGVGPAGSLESENVTYSANTNLHPRVWPVNAVDLYNWWQQRSNAQIAVSYSTTNGENTVTTFKLTGATDPNTAVELLIPNGASLGTVQVFANGSPANPSTYRTNGQVVKILVGTTVTNAQVLYFFGPQAQNDTFTFADGPFLSVPAPGVLVNDSAGAAGTGLTANLVTGPTNGTLSLNANGSFTYTPAPGFNGLDAFTYRVNDGFASSAPAQVLLMNANPPIFSDTFQRGTDPGPVAPWIIQGGAWTVSGGLLLGGPDPVQTYGYVYLTNNWVDYAATAQFRFPTNAFGGGLGGRLNPVTGRHYTAWIYPEGSSGGPKVMSLIKFLDWTTWARLQQVTLPTVGTNWHTVKLVFKGNQIAVLFDGAQVISVTDPTPYASGGVSVDMWTDAAGYVASVDNVTITPLVADNNYTAIINTALIVPAPGVLANDMGLSGVGLTAVALTTPTHGTLNLNATGGFTYTPAANYVGPDAFIYQANDGANPLGSAWVRITVAASGSSQANVNVAPIIQSIRIADGRAVVMWTAVSGRKYRLQYQNRLGAANWIDITPDVVATGGTASVTDDMVAGRQRFYRVLVVP